MSMHLANVLLSFGTSIYAEDYKSRRRMISSICIAFPKKPSQCRSMAKFFQSITNPPICSQFNANPMPMQVAFPFLLREQVIYWDPPLVSSEDDLGQSIPNSALHQSTPMPILVNPVKIMCQSRSIQCQFTPVPVPIWWPSGSINCQSIVSSGQICPCLANTPIKCQYWTYLPIPGQSTNPIPIRQFITNPPIQYQSANLIPILD